MFFNEYQLFLHRKHLCRWYFLSVSDLLRGCSTGIVKHDLSLHITELKTHKSTLSSSRYAAKTAIFLMNALMNTNIWFRIWNCLNFPCEKSISFSHNFYLKIRLPLITVLHVHKNNHRSPDSQLIEKSRLKCCNTRAQTYSAKFDTLQVVLPLARSSDLASFWYVHIDFHKK